MNTTNRNRETPSSLVMTPNTIKAQKKDRWIFITVIVAVSAIIIAAIIVIIVVVSRKGSKTAKLHRDQLQSNAAISPIQFTDKDVARLNRKYAKSSEITDPTIFVAISSYRDPELCLTLRDLFEKAYIPDRVVVGVVEQNDPKDPVTAHSENTLIFGKPITSKQLRVTKMSYKDAKGPTHARAICEKLWKGEEYFMMTDSHMRFEPGWDADCINMMKKSKRPRRTIITTYPEGYERKEEKDKISYKVGTRRGWRYQQIKKFNGEGIIEFESVSSVQPPPKTPSYVPMYGACFVFGHSDALKLVPFHPDTPYLFFGEEMFMAVRLLSHGFDLVGPTHSVAYHHWVRNYRKTFWDHDVVAQRDRSIRKIKDIMTGKIHDPKYGMGNVRSWAEIQDYLGIEFDTQKFTRPHQPWKPPKNFRELKDEFCENC